MHKTCSQCNSKINTNNTIYKGFDCTFCSSYCRTKMWTKVYAIDDNFKHPETWPNKEFKLNDIKLWTNSKSINDLTNIEIINDNNCINNFNSKQSNICNLIMIDNAYFSYMINSVGNFKQYIKYMILMLF